MKKALALGVIGIIFGVVGLILIIIGGVSHYNTLLLIGWCGIILMWIFVIIMNLIIRIGEIE